VRALILLALLAGPALASAASQGAARTVDIPGKLFVPDRITVLVGDTVTWTNHDSTTHTVTSDAFDSGQLATGASFEVAFDKPGSYRYHCTIHRFMRGEVDVFAVALSGPEHSVPLGSDVTLTGLAAPDAGSVTLEQQQGDGTYAAVASTGVGGDGAFSFAVAVPAPATYRVRAASEVSLPVHVAPQASVQLALKRRGARTVFTLSGGPNQQGATVALERYLPEHYWWRPVRRGMLGAGGSVTLTVPASDGARFRAHLVRGVGGWGEALSRPIRIA
jgi:plastocyanin